MTFPEVYYRLYLDANNKIQILCMQWFDELDYLPERFLSVRKFSEESEAVKYLAEQHAKGKTKDNKVLLEATEEFLADKFTNLLD